MLTFGKPESYSPNIEIVKRRAMTPNGAVLSVQIGNPLELQAVAPPRKNVLLADSSVIMLRVPVIAPDTEAITGYVVDVRGFVAKTRGARASVLLALGGATIMREWDYDEDVTPRPTDNPEPPAAPITLPHEAPSPFGRAEVPDTMSSGDFLESVFSLEPRPNIEENPTHFHAQPPFVAHLLLTVQRRTPQDGVTLVVDSLDIAAVSR
jgi:hypothetical protein